MYLVTSFDLSFYTVQLINLFWFIAVCVKDVEILLYSG